MARIALGIPKALQRGRITGRNQPIKLEKETWARSTLGGGSSNSVRVVWIFPQMTFILDPTPNPSFPPSFILHLLVRHSHSGFPAEKHIKGLFSRVYTLELPKYIPQYDQNQQLWYPSTYPSMTKTSRLGTGTHPSITQTNRLSTRGTYPSMTKTGRFGTREHT